MPKYPRHRKSKFDHWFRCGWCNRKIHGASKYLAHRCDEKPALAKFLVNEEPSKVENLNLPSDFGYKFIPPPEYWAKRPTVEPEK
jgi:hypothetical protein